MPRKKVSQVAGNDHTSASWGAEAPASWTIRYLSKEGFDCMLTLRGMNETQVLEAAEKAITGITEKNGLPTVRHDSQRTEAPRQSEKRNGDQGGAPFCPVHHVEMKRSKGGGWFCPQRIGSDDGGRPIYCTETTK